MSDEQPRYYRVVASIAIGTIVGWLSYRLTGASGGDFGYPWRAAGWVLDGKSPYANMTPSAAYGVGGPFLYPYWTALAVAPFRLLHDPRVAAAVFEGLSSAILSYIVTARGWLMLALFLSAPFYWSLQTANWPPLLLAAALGRGTAWLGAVKPNLGAVVLAYRPEKATFIGGAVLMAASLAISPGWPLEWLAHIRAQPVQHIPTVQWPDSTLKLHRALRWRTRMAARSAASICPAAAMT